MLMINFIKTHCMIAVVILASAYLACAADNDGVLASLVAKSPRILTGSLTRDPVGIRDSFGIIDYFVELNQVEDIRGSTKAEEVALSLHVREITDSDQSPYLI